MYFRGYPSHRYLVKSPTDQPAHAKSLKCYADHFIDTSVATVKKKKKKKKKKISKCLTILGELKKKH